MVQSNAETLWVSKTIKNLDGHLSANEFKILMSGFAPAEDRQYLILYW